MSNDLQVAGVALPSPLTAPCPTKVLVDVINRGPDPAVFPAPGMTICLDIAVGDRSVHYSITTAAEEPPLPYRAVRTFTFTGVQFPCAPSATLSVTADCAVSVPDNARTKPSLTVSVPNIQPVPWLWTDQLRVGLQDSTGYITWDPGALCPGGELVAEAVIRNAGCAVAVASVTTLELLDGNGQSVALLNQNTLPIAPGVSLIARFATAIPAAIPGQTLTIRACADATHVVTKQCDRQYACAEISKPLPIGFPAPTLTLSVARPIFPGEAVQISWQMDNACNDLGEITARVLFQGVELYKSVPIALGLWDRPKGERDLLITPSPAVARPFYTFGVKQLTLEVIGTGTNPGPYRTNATVTVIPESAAGSWAFTLPAPGSTIAWKDAYTVSGRLTNPAHATMSPSSLVLDETTPVEQPIERNASPLIGALTSGAFGTETWSLMQTWSWLKPGVWLPIGAQGGPFTYTVTFVMQDEFGNAYPASTSAALTVLVRVSDKKLALAASALMSFEAAITLTAIAIVALSGGYWTAGVVAACFTAAGILFGIAAGFGAGALDPPVADFDYGRVTRISLPELPAELADESALAPMTTVFAVLGRIIALDTAMSAAEARLIGARIDRNEEAVQVQSGEYRHLRDSLLTAFTQIPVAVATASDSEQARPVLHPPKMAEVRKAVREWSSSGVPAKLRRVAITNGLSTQDFRNFEQALTSPGFRLRAIDAPLNEISQAAANLGRAVRDEAELVLHPDGA